MKLFNAVSDGSFLYIHNISIILCTLLYSLLLLHVLYALMEASGKASRK